MRAGNESRGIMLRERVAVSAAYVCRVAHRYILYIAAGVLPLAIGDNDSVLALAYRWLKRANANDVGMKRRQRGDARANEIRTDGRDSGLTHTCWTHWAAFGLRALGDDACPSPFAWTRHI